MLQNFDLGMFDIIGLACVLVPALIAFIYIKMIKPWLGKKKTKKLEESGVINKLEELWWEGCEMIQRGEAIFVLSTDLYHELLHQYEKQQFASEIVPMRFNGVIVLHDQYLDDDTIILMMQSDYKI